MQGNQRRLFSKEEAAIYLGISPHTLTAWDKDDGKRVPCVRLGNRVLYDQADLDKFIESKKNH